MIAQLETILESTRHGVARRKQSANRADLEHRAESHVPRGFVRQLRKIVATGTAVIAELKKASPSRGLIRADFDAAGLAVTLEKAGSAALSVLTEENFFQGSLGNLQRASAATIIPCLRKDFIVDEFQVLESRAFCADAILLIVAALDDATLRRLTLAAHNAGLDVLCEIHDMEELARVQDLDCDAIGVNNRNLKTFEVNLENALQLAGNLPTGPLRVAESGIYSARDIERLQSAGFEAFLIGESLMKEERPGEALKALLAQSGTPREVPA